MQKSYLLVDGNSLGHVASNLPVLKLGTTEVQAIFNFLRLFKGYLVQYHDAIPVVLWDGTSWRNQMFPEYKANRDKAETPHEIKRQAQRKSYAAQRPHIQKALSLLGVTQVQAQNMEADDLAAIMTDRYVAQGSRVWLLTDDKDWFQLVQSNVALERFRETGLVRASNFLERTGCKTPQEFVQVKALMGDDGDNIKGIGGIGKKRAHELIATFGSFDRFLESVMLKEVDFAGLPKYLRDLVENEEKALKFAFNIKLVDLRCPHRPEVEGLQVNRGEPSEDKFRRFCEILMFQHFLKDWDNFLNAFPVRKHAHV